MDGKAVAYLRNSVVAVLGMLDGRKQMLLELIYRGVNLDDKDME